MYEAADITTGSRNATHGNIEDNFWSIAERWTAYLRQRKLLPPGYALKASDVALMMVDMKMARITSGDDMEADHYRDIIGYAGIAFELAGPPKVADP